MKDGIDVVVFLDADLSDDPAMLPRLVEPILSNRFDFVVGSRVRALREPGAMTFPQAFANWLFPLLMRLGWGFAYTDMGPFRAIRRSALEAVGMRDRAFGWTIEMQIRAVELGLRIAEVPVPYRRRPRGPSKISGTVRGVVLAAYWITRTCGALWLTKRSRRRSPLGSPPARPTFLRQLDDRARFCGIPDTQSRAAGFSRRERSELRVSRIAEPQASACANARMEKAGAHG